MPVRSRVGGQDAGENSYFELPPGVVVTGDGSSVVLPSPGSGVEAVEIRSGRSQWNSSAAALPLASRGGRLLALAELDGGARLDLVILDQSTGDRNGKALRLALPEDVRPSIDDRLDSTLSVRTWRREGAVYLGWSYAGRTVTGVEPQPGREGAPVERYGAARIDFDRETLEPLDVEEGLHWSEPLPRVVARVFAREKPGRQPWRAAGVLAYAELTGVKEGAPRVELRRWHTESGTELFRLTLLDARPVMWLPSADERHLAVVRWNDPAIGGQEYTWAIHSLSDGALVGELAHHRSATPFFLSASTLVHVSPPYGRRQGDAWVERPLGLRAVDLADGSERWTRKMRDVTYRGPVPPGG